MKQQVLASHCPEEDVATHQIVDKNRASVQQKTLGGSVGHGTAELIGQAGLLNNDPTEERGSEPAVP